MIIFILCVVFLSAWSYLYEFYLNSLVLLWTVPVNYYCVLMFVLACFYFVARYKYLPDCKKSSPVQGYLLLFLSGLLFFVGRGTGHNVSVFFSMWLSLISLVFFIYGSVSFRILWPVIFLTGFSIPVPLYITHSLESIYAQFSAEFLAFILSLSGTLYSLTGDLFSIGKVFIPISIVFSGGEYLFSVLALGLVVGIILCKRPLSQFLVMVISPIILLIVITVRARLDIIFGYRWLADSIGLNEGKFPDIIFISSCIFIQLLVAMVFRCTERDKRKYLKKIKSTYCSKNIFKICTHVIIATVFMLLVKYMYVMHSPEKLFTSTF